MHVHSRKVRKQINREKSLTILNVDFYILDIF